MNKSARIFIHFTIKHLTNSYGKPAQCAGRRTLQNSKFEKLHYEVLILCIPKKNLKFHQNRVIFVEVLASLKFASFP